MSQVNTSIDSNLYDRQIRTYGMDAVKKLTSSSVLIYGLEKGLGTEVAKNLALGGIRNIYLLDEYPIQKSDLETGFYYNVNNIGLIRSEVLANRISELNPYVNVKSVSSYNQDQNVTILINQPVQTVNRVSTYCEENSSKMIVLYSRGVSGVIFVNAGTSHTVTDVTGENIEPVQIGEISSEGKVRCATNNSHDYQTGDYIRFENLQGENLEQLSKEWKIKVLNKSTFQLEDFQNIKPFNFINGTAIYIKKPKEVKHENWTQQLENPTIAFSFDMDLSKKLVQTYIQMFTNNLVEKMPRIWSEEMTRFMETNKIILPEYASIFGFEFIPVVSLMGSICASEAIKLITNKYLPINQWFSWCDSVLIPKSNQIDLNVKTSYGQVWGKELEDKLMNSKWFMVGSGAIGCEHLKNLAFMNVSNVIVTDPDQIEKSNLNRQFLFRSQHIGKSKSETAAAVIQQMRPNMNIKALLHKVGNDNMELTNQIMSSGITGVLNALDNINARRFMDEQCLKFSLPLFESGTTGTKGNTQAVIPFVTETYSNSSDPIQEKSFPICTIKSFPNEIHHTIHWAMDQFEFFNRAPATMNRWIRNPEEIESMEQTEKMTAYEDINKFTVQYPTQKLGLRGCAIWAVEMFNQNYNNNIVQLLHTFPPNYEIAEGVPFWSAGKRCPKPIKFDITNQMHLDYVEATTHLLARVSGLSDNFTTNKLIKMIEDYVPKEFVPKDMEIASNDSELEKTSSVRSITDYPIGNSSDFNPIFVPETFEKDDDTNWHIKWITACSNNRAVNYGIPIADYQETKGIAGRIIPAIATTTSAVSGLILLEMLKYLQGHNKVESYRSTFLNLAEPTLVYSEPMKAPMIELAGIKLNSWTRFEYSKDSTLAEFKEYYEKIFQTSINTIILGTGIIYMEHLETSNLDRKLSQIVKEVMDEIPSVISFILASNDLEEIPTITFKMP
jgi:ubiquitin-activating enzyme E1